MAQEECRILFVEDTEEDFELESRELRRAGLAFTAQRVETREEIIRTLSEFKPNLVISDYSLPTMDGLTALKIVREISKEVPFVFVSGTIGEDRAIESLKNGATDYVVKGKMGGLGSRVRRALSEAQERTDRRRAEELLRQAQKMEAIGRLAGGVAHDFNNLLTVINGYSQLMMGQVAPGNPLHSNAEEILKAGERAASLTRQLLAFSRKQVLAPVILNLNSVVSQVEKMLRRLIGEDIKLVASLEPNLGSVKADPGQIEQVLMNLAVNARDAMPKGGKLTLETANVTLDETYAEQHPGIKPGPHVMLAVSDTGTGMDQETQSHLFEPFFTTKEQGKGTGLGLSTVFGIVKQSEGSIWVYSELGKGTTFKVYLPRVDQAAPSSTAGANAGRTLRGTETILLVEDSESVRKLVSAVLAQQGYTVLTADDGESALQLLRQHQGRLDLLMTDVVLPGLGGPEIAAQVIQARPGIKVLFCSGYTERGVIENGALPSGSAFLQKPFTPESLGRKIRDMLGVRA
jgi:two-component system cell cycle sensor histidine kinase/response regulator CckA